MPPLSIPEDKFETRATTKKLSARRRWAVTFLSIGDQLVIKNFFKLFEVFVFVFLYTLRLHCSLQLSMPMLHGRKSTSAWKNNRVKRISRNLGLDSTKCMLI
jgi:hypothetical protein